MIDAVIVIPTNSKYIDVCFNFLQLLKKYWDSCPYKIVLSVYGCDKEIECPYADVIYSKKSKSLIDCIRVVVNKYQADYYISFLGDAFINEKIDQKIIEAIFKTINVNNINYCSLLYVMNYRKRKKCGRYLRFINTDDRYSHSFVAFIASKNYMRNDLLKFHSDLEFEKYYLSFNGNNKYYKDHVAVSQNYLHIIPGINKGKWDRFAYLRLKIKNPEITFARRNFCSWSDSITYQLHDRLIGYFPPELRITLKNMYSKLTGKRFVTDG